MNGEFVRVGPNPKFSHVAGYHWYETYMALAIKEYNKVRVSYKALNQGYFVPFFTPKYYG